MVERHSDGRWKKGESACPGGGPKTRLDQMVVFDVKQAARRYCPEAIEVIAKCLHSKNEKIRLLAAQLLIERGYGRPEIKADIETMHRFVQAPATITNVEEWLACRGNPQAVEPKLICKDAICEANTIDLELDDKPN